MKSRLMAILLAAATLVAIGYLPAIKAHTGVALKRPAEFAPVIRQRPVVDAVFVLDTTGSMSGLIETAKEKIWSIASTMASAQPAPLIRIGLVAYRDRGDDYVVRTVDLSEDLDAVYAELMRFQADGGGDGPESVNAALNTAVTGLSWSDHQQAYKVIFLVGDAPPHMDYPDERRFPEIVADARERGIVVNAIQCGTMPATNQPWAQIASLGGGMYFQVEQAGSAVAYSTPFDKDLAALSARLDRTRLYYGSEPEREAMAAKMAAAESIAEIASDEAKARRGVFNLSAAGRANRLGKNELVSDYSSGDVSLDDLDQAALPEPLKPMAPREQKAFLDRLVAERSEVEERMRELASAREKYLRDRVEEEGGATDSLDQKLYDAISRQAVSAGLEYEDGPAY